MGEIEAGHGEQGAAAPRGEGAGGAAAPPGDAVDRVGERPPDRARLWYLLLLVPFVGLLWVPLYAHPKPELFGFPFFYWYQFAWVPVTALITWFVSRKVK